MILCDLGLPTVDGFELARQFGRLPETRSSLLVAVTGHGQDGDRERSRKAGFQHHIVKPVSPDSLIPLLQSLDGEMPDGKP